MRFQPRPLEQPEGVLQRLLAEAIPARQIRRAATVGPSGDLDAPKDLRRRNGANYLHALADGRIVRPPAEAAWWAGLAAASVTLQRWCNPTLFLFAAGHYVEFAAVMLTADDRMPRDRRLDLVLTVLPALEPTPPPLGREELVRRRVAEGHDELSARRAAEWDLTMEPKPRPDRVTWSIDGSEAETLRAAWLSLAETAPDLGDPTLAACYLAAEGRLDKAGPDVSLALRGRIAVDAIAAALR